MSLICVEFSRVTYSSYISVYHVHCIVQVLSCKCRLPNLGVRSISVSNSFELTYPTMNGMQTAGPFNFDHVLTNIAVCHPWGDYTPCTITLVSPNSQKCEDELVIKQPPSHHLPEESLDRTPKKWCELLCIIGLTNLVEMGGYPTHLQFPIPFSLILHGSCKYTRSFDGYRFVPVCAMVYVRITSITSKLIVDERNVLHLDLGWEYPARVGKSFERRLGGMPRWCTLRSPSCVLGCDVIDKRRG